MKQEYFMITDADKELLKEQAAIRKPFEVEEGGERIIPIPKVNSEAMAQLKSLYGAIWCSIIKFYFLKNLGYQDEEVVKKAIKEKIEDLDNFIANANNQRLTNKDDIPKRREELNDIDYYMRLKYDYYLHNDLDKRDLENDSLISKVYGNYFLFYNFLQGKLKETEPQQQIQEADEIIKPDAEQEEVEIKLSPNKKSKKDATKSKILSEIWIGEQYEEVITLLKKEYGEIKYPFIKDISGRLSWSKNPTMGWQMYLAGFIYQCNEDRFIDLSQFSIPEIMEICKNTFAIDKLSPDAFSQVRGKSLDNKYITPFETLFEELKVIQTIKTIKTAILKK